MPTAEEGKEKPILPKLTISEYASEKIVVEKPVSTDQVESILAMKSKALPAIQQNTLRNVREGTREPYIFSDASTIQRIDPDTLLTADELAERNFQVKPRDPVKKYLDKGIDPAKVAPTLIHMLEENCQAWNLTPMKNASDWLSMPIPAMEPQRSNIILKAMAICGRELHEKQLASIKKISDLVAVLSVKREIPIIEGNPLDELFRGAKLPPNVSVRIAVDRSRKVNARTLFPTNRDLYEKHINNQ